MNIAGSRHRNIGMLAVLVVGLMITGVDGRRPSVKVTVRSDEGEEETDADLKPEEEDTEAPELFDLNFDLAVKAQIRAYPYRQEEPALPEDTQYVDENVENWSFAYEGGEFAKERAPNKKAVTWAIGILGIDVFENTYKVTAMGALITPRILMTLCASINSFYRSYRGILYEEKATQELFKVSNTSDQQFDIRTPDLIAYWNTRDGFNTKSGDENVMLISRHILTTDQCTNAVEGHHINETIQQYKTPAFLLLANPITNPFGSDLDAFISGFLFYGDDDDVSSKFRQRPKFPLEMIAYRQRVCHWPRNVTQLTQLKVWKKPKSDEIVEPNLHLLSTGWTECSSEPFQKRKEFEDRPWELKNLHACSYYYFDKYKEADEDIDPSTQELRLWAKEFKTAMAEALQKPYVGCMEWARGNLCDAPPGSPVFYFHKRDKAHAGTDYLIALTITSPRTEPTKKMDASGNMIVMMLTHEAGKRELVDEINGLIEYVKNLGRTREQATDYPVYNELEETKEIPLELLGNLDSDVVPDMIKSLQDAGIIKLSGLHKCPPTVPPALLGTLIAFILACSSS